MAEERTYLEKALAEKFAGLVKAGHNPEEVALAALDAACGFLSAARGPLWLAEQLDAIARGLVRAAEPPPGHSAH
jgi:hypothetical protein